MDGGIDEDLAQVFAGHVGAIVDAAGDLLLLLDAEAHIQAVADPGTPTLGYARGQLAGRPLTDLFAAAVDTDRVESFEQAVYDGNLPNQSISLEAADGSAVFLSVSAVSRAADSTLCVLEERSNQTVRHDVELLGAVADPVYALDAEDCLIRVNDAMVELTGYDRPDLLGRDITALVPARSYDRLRRLRETLLDGEAESATTELPIITDEGGLIMTEVHVTVQTEDGSYAGSVGTLRDIRERTRRERNLDLLKELLTRVFRHNVRNELMVAQTHTELLENKIDPAFHTHIAEIREASDRLLAHTKKARQIEGVIEHDTRTDVDLAAAVTELVASARDRDPDATVALDLPPEWVVEAHPDINMAIEELIDNAIRHAPDEPQLDIWLDSDGRGETLFVEDESGGLAPEEIQVLRRGTEDKLQHGSGVGLWLVRWLVEYSDAELVVHTTSNGTVAGIRFGPHDRRVGIEDSPLARAPEAVRELAPERFHGETVIERAEILEKLDEQYDSLDETGGHTVLVTGEAGIGKTTLVEQFQQRLDARDESPLVATGVCNETIQPPYYAFRQILRELPGEGGVLENVPSVADLGEIAEDKEALFDQIAETIRDVAADRPVVLIVDDMQWADEGTIALFEYLIEEVGRWRHPVLFLGTYRTSDVDEEHPVLAVAEETAEAGRGTVIELEPLNKHAVEALLLHMLGIDTLSQSFANSFYEQTGGTPLFVQELGRHIAETLGSITGPDDLPTNLDEVAVPDTVERAVADRLDVLPADVRPVLNLGAVSGQTFSFDVLREASTCSTDQLIDTIDILVDRQVWSRSGGNIEFIHGVVREQALAEIDEESRRQLHGRVAAAIETVYADELSEFAASLAHHSEQADAYADAFEYYRLAGDNAADTYANEDAISHYERARSLADEHGVAPDGAVAAVTLDLASIFELTGMYEQATATYEESLDRYQQAGDRQGEADCLGHLGSIARKRGEYEQATQYLEESIEIRQRIDDQSGETEGLKKLGNIAWQQCQYDLAREYYRDSLDRFREISDEHGQAKCFHNLGIVARRGGEYDQAREYYEQSLRLSRETGDREAELHTLNALGVLALKKNLYERSNEYFEQSFNIAEETGNQYGKSKSLTNLGINAYRQGAYNQAKEYLEKSLAIGREIGDRTGESQLLENLADLAIRQGRYADAQSYIDESIRIAEAVNNPPIKALSLCNRSHIEVRENRLETAKQSAKKARTIIETTENTLANKMSLCALATVARKEENYDEALRYLTEAVSVGYPQIHKHIHARAHLERCRVALAQDNIDEAREAVREADEIASELHLRHEQGHISHLRGRIAKATGSPDEAIEHWQQALEQFEEIDAPQDVLRSLRALIECEAGADTNRADWIEHATEIFERAPDGVKDQHHEWLETYTAL